MTQAAIGGDCGREDCLVVEVGDRSALRQQGDAAIGQWRSGGDADRGGIDKLVEARPGGEPGDAGRDQHMARRHAAASRPHRPALRGLAQRYDAAAGMDRAARRRHSTRQPVQQTGGIEQPALRQENAAGIAVRADRAGNRMPITRFPKPAMRLPLREAGSRAGQRFLRAIDGKEAASRVTVDAERGNPVEQPVARSGYDPMQPRGPFRTEPRPDLLRRLARAVEERADLAGARRRGIGGERPGLEQDNRPPRLRQLQRGDKTGKTGPDHDDVGGDLFRKWRESGRGPRDRPDFGRGGTHTGGRKCAATAWRAPLRLASTIARSVAGSTPAGAASADQASMQWSDPSAVTSAAPI